MRRQITKLAKASAVVLIGLIIDVGYFNLAKEPCNGSYLVFLILVIVEFILLNIMTHMNRRWTESLQNSSPRES